MKSIKSASLFWLVLATASVANVYAFDEAGGTSRLNFARASNAETYRGNFIRVQNSCMNACRDKMQSCMAQIDSACNSKGCNNERGACNEQYSECTKNCSGR